MVGTVGGMLGDAGVNIAGMQVCRDRQGGQALVALAVDTAIPPSASRRSGSAIDAVEVRARRPDRVPAPAEELSRATCRAALPRRCIVPASDRHRPACENCDGGSGDEGGGRVVRRVERRARGVGPAAASRPTASVSLGATG